MSGLRRLALSWCSGTASTALAVTSAPVPAVVGTATQGAAGRVIGRPDPDDLQVVQRVTAVAQQHGHGLAGVDDAAAADRDDRVGSVVARGGDGGPGQLHRRLVRHREHRGGQPDAGQQPGVTRRVGARAHQHPRSEPGQHARQFGHPAGPDHNAPGRRELERACRHGEPLAQPPESAGYTAEYRADSRGCAIISATASRQVA